MFSGKIVIVLVAGLISGPSFASTTCSAHVVTVKSVADGATEIYFDQAAPFSLASGAPNIALTVSVALTAIASNRSVLVTFGSDNAGCSANSALRGDFSALSIVGGSS